MLSEVFSPSQTKYFGDDPDTMRYPGADVIYGATLEEKGYRLLGKGSYRNTYEIPGKQEYVIKVAHTHSDSFVNELEAEATFQTSYPDFIPRVYAAADDFLWIISERINVIGSQDEFAKVLMSTFPSLARVVGDNITSRVLCAFSHALGESNMTVCNIPGDVERDLRVETKRFINMCHEFDIETFEVRVENVGFRNTPQGKKLVLLDTSRFLSKES